MNIFLILPNQLFEDVTKIKKLNIKKVYILEHPVYFTKYKFHPLKLIFHRATMKYYYTYLKNKLDISITYIDFNKYSKLNLKNSKIIMYDPVDIDIYKEFKKYKIKYLDTPLFLSTINNLTTYLKNNKSPFIHKNFYIWQRKRLNIFIDKSYKPLYSKWSFDDKNRCKFPSKQKEIMKIKYYKNNYIEEAQKYVNINFKYDKSLGTDMWLPITHYETKKYFLDFLVNRLNNFGKYQDATSTDIIVGYHSAISPLLNIGLIEPKTIIEYVIKYFKSHKSLKLYYSIEGYIRQIIGWREYVRLVYIYQYKNLFKNKLNHKNKLTSINNLKTSILPIDTIIEKIKKWSWLHHIDRLMFLGNYFLLCEINPKYVMIFFMENVSLDAYDWVMVPNVYGMSQYSGLNIMTTRPYFSSSNYLLKMSNYKKGDWCEIWNALYYNFINNNKEILRKNYATANSVKLWNAKSSSEQYKLLDIAKKYIKKLMNAR